MRQLFLNVFMDMLYWGYYRWGWARASWLGVQISWCAQVSPRAKLVGVAALGRVEIGRNVSIGTGTYIGSGLIASGHIGKFCSIATDVVIGPSEHRLDHWTTSPYEARLAGEPAGATDLIRDPPIIESGVWIGTRVIILRGVRIGSRSVIAAGAVVNSDVPSGEVWGGVPAKFLRRINAGDHNEEIIA
jgi:acetyltransferase-like isoleucine patch superfamily enzyme